MSRVDGLKCNVQGMTGRVMEQGFDVQGLRVKGQVVRGEFDGHAVHLCVLVKGQAVRGEFDGHAVHLCVLVKGQVVRGEFDGHAVHLCVLVKGQVVRGEFDGHAVHLCVLVKPRPKHVPPDHFVWGSSHRCLSRSWGSFLFPSAARLFFFI